MAEESKPRMTGIVDVPISTRAQDQLNMKSFEEALAAFITHTATPMTVAIQGEWGSGKTSMMNRLSERLCTGEHPGFYSIWLNTWHYALVDKPESTFSGIIQNLIAEVAEISGREHPDKSKKLIKDVSKISRNVLRGLSYMALKTVVPQLSDEGIKDFDATVFQQEEERPPSLNDLRAKLGALVSQTIDMNREKGVPQRAFLFFIDDLDRIEPSVAVTILELLKNIFDLEHCIFVLAIDYDVVVSGLKPKFGELTEANEREFRSFFDKIIQLPFRMPVQSFVIDEFLKDTMLSIGFITDEEAADHDFIESLAEFARLSMGPNPRSLKRLANSLSFISLLIQAEGKRGHEAGGIAAKQVTFAMVCLQIAFPQVYNLLAERPEFRSWDEEFAMRHHATRDTLGSDALKQRHDALEGSWQRILFNYCSHSPFLSRHSQHLISFFSMMNQLSQDGGQAVGDLVADVFAYSSVTSVRAETQKKFEINPVRVFFALNQKLLPLLQEGLTKPFDSVERSGRIIARLPFLFKAGNEELKVIIKLPVKHYNLAVRVSLQVVLFPCPKDATDAWALIGERGKSEAFRQLSSAFIDLDQSTELFHMAGSARGGLSVNKGKVMLEVGFQTYVDSIEQLYTSSFLESLSAFILKLAHGGLPFVTSSWEPAN